MTNNESSSTQTRRRFVRAIPLAGAVAFGGTSRLLLAEQKHTKADEEVSTNEDLMREHGILKRVLLAYEEIVRRIRANQDFPAQAVTDGTDIIRKFIENYHERLEEEHLFPRFRKAGKLVDLVNTLQTQHQAGRRVTDRISATAASLTTQDKMTASNLASELQAFNRMYAPHEAREDTVLFPELHKILSPHEYDSLGEQFESIERKTFGGDGFDIYVDKIADVEKQLGIYDLNQFTPK
jgi:hemerythrin-like domain-containing protein